MKTTSFTIPKLSSVENNEITDLFSVAEYLPELRLVQLEGIPVRIEVNRDKYIELSSEEEEIELSDYTKILEKLFDFFYGTAYLYGFINDKKLKIYDIYTNDNFLSTRDMLFLEANYGLPIAKPIYEGKFQFDFLVEILNKKINGEGMKQNTFHILPSVYINDGRPSSAVSSNALISKVIVGEKKEYKPWNGYSGSGYSYPSTTTYSTPAVTTTKTSKQDKIFKEIFLLSTKEERTDIFKEVCKNVNAYIEKVKSSLKQEQLDWWKKFGRFYMYLYSILSIPETRQIVYDYCAFYILEVSWYTKPIEVKWARLFLDFFAEDCKHMLELKKIEKKDMDAEYLAAFMKEEFIEFDKFFVKETKKEEDWRYGENLGTYGGWI